MAVDRDEVLRVAALAQLELAEVEVSELTGKLTQILAHVEKLRVLDLSGVEPTAHVLDMVSPERNDEIQPGLDRERALGSSASTREGLFVVPRILREN